MADLGAKRALVIGLGRSGESVARALVDAGVEVVATDAHSASDGTPHGLPDGVEVHLGIDGDQLVPLVDTVDLVVPSPGVPESAPAIRRALELGLEVWSEPELGFRLAPRRLVGITGTNGKTSTTELTQAMLVADGVDAVACGNIGHPFTTAALGSAPDATLVAELSSFQLRFAVTLRPVVGVLLNVAPDHLDWHGELTSYARAKARLWMAQDSEDWAVSNADDPIATELARAHAPGRVAWTSHTHLPDVGVGIDDGALVARLPVHTGPLVELEALPVTAPHHVANVAAAAAAALLGGASADAVSRAARTYRPGRHRLEVVHDAHGVTWVDDSKATNVHAAIASLRSFAERPIVWIAGGLAKGVDLRPIGEALAHVRLAVLIGEAADDLREVAAEAGVPSARTDTIEDAVRTAHAAARRGDVVLLAPACASFDQFRDYAERGDRFAAAAREVAS